METSAIIVAVIAAVASVFGAIFTYFSNRHNSKSDKTISILEQQYLKVISPLHQALHIRSVQKMCDTIDSIIHENYYLLPDELFDEYAKFRKCMLHSEHPYIIPLESDFGVRVSEFNTILRYKLGYSKIKVTKKEKKAEKLLANSHSSIHMIRIKDCILMFTLILILISLIIYIFLPKLHLSLNIEYVSRIIILLCAEMAGTGLLFSVVIIYGSRSE